MPGAPTRAVIVDRRTARDPAHFLADVLARAAEARDDLLGVDVEMNSATSQISSTASKGGVLALSRELGVQFAKDPERAERRLVHVPMGRFAEPEEIAGAYVAPS